MGIKRISKRDGQFQSGNGLVEEQIGLKEGEDKENA